MAAAYPILGRVLGHYRVQEQIGAGGMGIVFRAHDLRLERDVALKVLPPGTVSDDAARQRFRQEALALSKIEHDHVARIYDFDTQDGIDFLAMEFVRGVTLSHKLARGPLVEENVLRLGRQIAEALAAASAFGIVHRDLKPGNIIITPTGDAKLLDFGLAKLIQGDELTRSSTSGSASWTGTLYYMAPEQLKGETGDFRSDVYQAGAVLYEAATGKKAFDGTPATLLQEILHKPPLAPRERNANISVGLEAIILCCLAKDPARRYQRASELRAALDTVGTISASQRPDLPATARGSRWGHWIAVLATILVVALGGVLIWRSRHHAVVPVLPLQVSQLAILPVAGNDSETTAFGNGLVHTLTSRLSQLTASHPLQVVPASDIRERHVESLEQASQEFGATLGLELSVERAGEMMRVNYALVEAGQHRQVNGDTITAPVSDPFGLEDRVAESVVRALQVELRPEERQSLVQHGTNQPAAYDYYLQGWGYLQDFLKPENVDNAIVEFERALKSDPKYSLAFAGLGEAYWRKYQDTQRTDLVEKAKAACKQSEQLNPKQVAAHLCLGLVNQGTGAYDKALEEYKLAADLEPTNDAAYNGMAAVYGQLGKNSEAESTFKRAISLRPNYWANYNQLGGFYYQQGRYADAVQMFSQVIALAPDSFAGYSNLAGSYFAKGEYEKGIPLLEHSIAIRATPGAVSNLGTAYFALHKYSEAARTFEKAVAMNGGTYDVWSNLGDAYYWSPEDRGKAKTAYGKAIELALKSFSVNPRDPELLQYLAQDYAMSGECDRSYVHIRQALKIAPSNTDLLGTAALVFNQCGDQDQALSYMEKAVAAGYSRRLLRDTPNFDNLRDLPRFKRIVGP